VVKKIRLVVICATGLATATMAATKLETEFKRRGVPVKISKGRVSDMRGLVSQTKPDLVVATARINKDMGIPVFDGVPLLSGRGVDKLFDDIFEYVDKLAAES